MRKQRNCIRTKKKAAKFGASKKDVWVAYEGRCFYCDAPTQFRGKTYDDRDWILAHGRKFAVEHAIPLIRGGNDHASNSVPSCYRCNREKGALTSAEFRFLRGIAAGTLNFTFPFEKSKQERDWLVCVSPSFARRLMAHNFE